ncbi:tRNA lysidine(34) synthetase TilS [Serratia microhaemolytica]|uniref:tRNA lysidine(34) synthetase TilS n=1 Tax=Serratia microhaemolytica TaxID=2675110 RepID=UPI000FDF26E5|nr:tRNA lysidine(34) synthetase TilS [Serratia microhaemolytica]
MRTDPFLIQLAEQLGEQRQLLVGFSGGLDSTVLLDALWRLRQQQPDIQLRAVHVHHGLSRFADQWVAHCQQQCDHWQIPLRVHYVQLDSTQAGIEAAARQARYRAFRQTLQVHEALLTAHHLDDQCETLLLALKRGSGPAGLGAMLAQGQSGQHRLLRPLLAISRQQLERYAQQHALRWIEDESNQDTRFDRNFLRRDVVPLLSQRWPHFAQAVARSASLCAEQEQLLDELLAEPLAELTDHNNAISIEGLSCCSAAKRAALLRRWIASSALPLPSRDGLHQLWQQVALSKPDAEPVLQLSGYQVRRFQQRLYLLPPMADLSQHCLLWHGETRLLLPDGLGSLQTGEGPCVLRAPHADEQVTVRFSAAGRVRVVGRAGSRPIKKLWQELAVAPWLRKRIPLIYYNQQLIAAVDHFITEAGQPQLGQPSLCLQWCREAPTQSSPVPVFTG